jgi:hypothetical protein
MLDSHSNKIMFVFCFITEELDLGDNKLTGTIPTKQLVFNFLRKLFILANGETQITVSSLYFPNDSFGSIAYARYYEIE